MYGARGERRNNSCPEPRPVGAPLSRRGPRIQVCWEAGGGLLVVPYGSKIYAICRNINRRTRPPDVESSAANSVRQSSITRIFQTEAFRRCQFPPSPSAAFPDRRPLSKAHV